MHARTHIHTHNKPLQQWVVKIYLGKYQQHWRWLNSCVESANQTDNLSSNNDILTLISLWFCMAALDSQNTMSGNVINNNNTFQQHWLPSITRSSTSSQSNLVLAFQSVQETWCWSDYVQVFHLPEANTKWTKIFTTKSICLNWVPNTRV